MYQSWTAFPPIPETSISVNKCKYKGQQRCPTPPLPPDENVHWNVPETHSRGSHTAWGGPLRTIRRLPSSLDSGTQVKPPRPPGTPARLACGPSRWQHSPGWATSSPCQLANHLVDPLIGRWGEWGSNVRVTPHCCLGHIYRQELQQAPESEPEAPHHALSINKSESL